MDTGAHRTIIDTKMAEHLGLKVRTQGLKFGRFSVPGSDAVHEYAGVVDGDTILHVGDKLFAKVSNMRVINHPQPFMLLGADVLSGGRPSSTWNFTGLKVDTLGTGQVQAHLTFKLAGVDTMIELPHAPVGEHLVGTLAGGNVFAYMAGGAPLPSGQCLRRHTG